METKKSEFRHEIEHEGYPPVSNEEDYRSLEDLLKSLDPEEAIKELECGPPVLPSRIFNFADLGSLLKKIAGDVWYYNEATGVSVNPEDLGIDSSDPDALVERVTGPDGSYLKMTKDKFESGKVVPGGKGTTQQLEQIKGELIERFAEADDLYEVISADKRYSAPGVFDQGSYEEWIEFYSQTRDDLYTEKLIRSEGDISLMASRIDNIINQGSAAVSKVNEGTATIPPGANVYYLDKDTMIAAPNGMKGYPISETTINNKGEKVPAYEMITPEGERFVILKRELIGEEEGRGKASGIYFIPEGMRIHDPNTHGKGESVVAPQNIYGVVTDREKTRPDQFGLPEDANKSRISIYDFKDSETGVVWKVRQQDLRHVKNASLHTAGIETTEDRPPYAWRDEPETQEINITHSPIDGDKPFHGPPNQGVVPFLSMPNVGDVMTDRTNERGKAGDAEYLGKDHEKIQQEQSKIDMKTQMLSRYQADLDKAIAEGQPPSIIKHYEQMIKRYQDDAQ